MSDDVPDIIFTWGGITNEVDKRNRYNGELYYSIKAVLKYLPWCKNIYILVNSNVDIPPEILSLDPLKIKRVDRSKLIENKQTAITQNSFAVYSIIDKIPNLNERFILFDDDFMMLKYTPIEFFFEDHYPIVRANYKKQKIYKDDVIIPPYLKRPIYKYRDWSHKPKPCTKTIIQKFRMKYPEYNSFVESHITRFHGVSEEMLMIYYQFGLENNLIKPVETKSDLFQIKNKHSNNIFIFTLEFVMYIIIIFLKSYNYLNINDDWSYKKNVYNKQIKIVKTFLYYLYGK